MTDWLVNRWRRYGQDELYAEAAGGTTFGSVDHPTSNEPHPAEAGGVALLTAAVVDRLSQTTPAGRHADTGFAPTAPGKGSYAARHKLVDWQDLASDAPAAGGRDQPAGQRNAASIRTIISRLLSAPTEERDWWAGQTGERAIAAQLAGLGPAWRSIQSVDEQGADVDHVVIGPAGVFTVSAKPHPNASVWVGADTFLVNGTRTWYVRDSRQEAARASRLLSLAFGQPVPVRGIIVVIGAHRGLTIKEQPHDGAVQVVGRGQLAEYLTNLPTVLDPDTVATLYTLACRSTTWRPVADAAGR